MSNYCNRPIGHEGDCAPMTSFEGPDIAKCGKRIAPTLVEAQGPSEVNGIIDDPFHGTITPMDAFRFRRHY